MTRSLRGTTRTAALGGVALLAGLALAGSAAVTASPGADAPDVGTVAVGGVAPSATAPRPSPTAAPVTGPPRIGVAPVPVGVAPVTLDLGFAGRQAPVVPVGVLRNGSLVVPGDPRTVGWWTGGAAPGDATGPVVVAGHLDSATGGLGVLTVLLRARPGQEVALRDGAGQRYRYRITGRHAYPRDGLPAGLFRRGGPPRLLLLTCGGGFDARTRHYRDTVVVAAEPVRA